MSNRIKKPEPEATEQKPVTSTFEKPDSHKILNLAPDAVSVSITGEGERLTIIIYDANFFKGVLIHTVTAKVRLHKNQLTWLLPHINKFLGEEA